MRVAFVLPSLPAGSLPLRDLLAVARALVGAGVELEGFAEEPRAWSGAGLPTFHYLRLPERHAAAPFATGLYALGRDGQPYEPAYLCAMRFPGLVWALDPVLHHLLIGGIALRGRWQEYEELVERAFPGRGEGMADSIRHAWCTRAAFRRFDPVPELLRDQPAVCAGTPAIAAAFAARGIDTPVIGLPGAGEPQHRGTAEVRRVLLPTFHYGAPRPTLEALREVLQARPSMQATVVVPDFLLEAVIGPLAESLGIGERVRWLPPDDVTLMAHLQQADVVAHLRDDPVVGERALLQEAAARGMPLVVLRVPGAHGVPDDVAIGVDPGRAFRASLASILLTLHDRPELARAASERSSAWAARRPGAADAATALAGQLQRAATSGFGERRIAADTWHRLEQRARALVTPRFAGPEVATVTAARLRACAPPGLFAGQGRRPGAPVPEPPAPEA